MLYTYESSWNGRILGKWKPFRVKRKAFLTETSTPDTMEQSSQPRNVRKMAENGDEATRLHDLDLQQEWVFKQALIPCSTTQVFQQRMNTFSNHSLNQIKDQHTDVLTW
jgi:hypothetical protein